MVDEDSVERFLPLSPAVFHIMLALADGETHGYAVAKEVESSTRGTVRISAATLYRTLKQLSDDGWIVEGESNHHDQRRRVYSLTARGREIAAAEARRLSDAVKIARQRMLIPARGAS